MFRVARILPGLRTVARAPMRRGPLQVALRFNSTQNIGVTALVFPPDKTSISESDVDEWLNAVQKLKTGKVVPETEAELYIHQLVEPLQFLEEKFEPTEEQLAQVEKYAGKAVPLPNDPIIENVTNLIMRAGRKSQARSLLSKALYIVYLKTRQDPVKILHETLDKLAPLLNTQVQMTGFAKSKVVPYPLTKRKRIRFAVKWILEGAEKKKSPDFSVRLAEEIISAYEGKSSGYDKKALMHKNAIAQRAYVQL